MFSLQIWLIIFSLQLSAEGKKRLSGELGQDVEYDYNNANDTANFCPGLQVDHTLLLHVIGGHEDGLFNDGFCEQEGDSEDAEGFGSNDYQTDRPTPFSLNTEDISTYGEDCLVPEPHKVSWE